MRAKCRKLLDTVSLYQHQGLSLFRMDVLSTQWLPEMILKIFDRYYDTSPSQSELKPNLWSGLARMTPMTAHHCQLQTAGLTMKCFLLRLEGASLEKNKGCTFPDTAQVWWWHKGSGDG